MKKKQKACNSRSVSDITEKCHWRNVTAKNSPLQWEKKEKESFQAWNMDLLIIRKITHPVSSVRSCFHVREYRSSRLDEAQEGRKHERKENFSVANNAAMSTSSTFMRTSLKLCQVWAVYPGFMVHPAACRPSWIITPYLFYETRRCTRFSRAWGEWTRLVTIVRGPCSSSPLWIHDLGPASRKRYVSLNVRHVGTFRETSIIWRTTYNNCIYYLHLILHINL